MSICLGNFIRQAIEAEGLSHEDACKALQLSESHLRITISGHANLHPKKAFNLMQAFSSLEIRFDSLSKVLVGVQYLESKMGNVDELRAALNTLSTDYEFSIVFRGTDIILTGDSIGVQEALNLEKELKKKERSSDFFDLLTKGGIPIISSSAAELRTSVTKILHDTPSILNKYLAEEFGQLRSRIRHLKQFATSYDLKRWEEDLNHNNLLKKYSTVVTSIDRIRNVEYYTYDFIAGKNFEEFNVLVIQSPDSVEDVNVLRKQLIRFFEKQTSWYDKEVVDRKVSVRTISQEEVEKFKDSVFTALNKPDTELEPADLDDFEYIIYSIEGELPVGVYDYKSVSNNVQQHFDSLINSQVDALNELFGKYW